MSYKYEFGFIGCGNMGTAILSGILNAGIANPDQIAVSVRSQESADSLQQNYHVTAIPDKAKLIQGSRTVFLAIKPQVFEEVYGEIKDLFDENQLIISVMAGKSIDLLSHRLSEDKTLQIVRAMPNTPAMVLEAMTAVCFSKAVTSLNKELSLNIFNSIGKAEEISENMMDAVTGVSGSSPAYIYMLIEAMADAGVLNGLPRNKAYSMAAQAVLGSAKMVLETGAHPGVLKDAVTSPGGTTIEGLATLEAGGFRGLVMDGIQAAIDKSKDMSK